MRRTFVVYVIACAIAALLPVLSARSERLARASIDVTFPGWPNEFEGRSLTPLPLTQLEQRFGSDFPGKIGRFTDGKREIIIRWITQATRKLHPASDCFQGIGYSVKPLALHRDDNGSLWSSFAATKGNDRLRVYEQIHSDSGETWTDASAWYWSALNDGSGSWWAITIAEREY
ncbi:MAG TPA: hypothetical protein VJ875_20165 [Pyrinomonadaceae bacterium]|nr:hypothetical protein [Pyrinomonadaceae bacterium]